MHTRYFFIDKAHDFMSASDYLVETEKIDMDIDLFKVLIGLNVGDQDCQGDQVFIEKGDSRA
jgi:hypothetical protein